MKLRGLLSLAALGTLFLGGFWWSRSGSKPQSATAVPSPPSSATATASAAPPIKVLTGDLDATFLVASDTHIGYRAPEDPNRDPLAEPQGIELTNLAMIHAMNSIEGKPFPAPLGGRVARPRGVLVSGDLTEDGGKEQWRLWTRFYGLTGHEGALQFPVFEGAGNHDRNKNWYVREQVKKRHTGRFYTLDWGDLRVVCLGEGPDDEGLRHLERALDGAARDVPFVIYLHYPLLGAYSDDNWFGRGEYRDRLAQLLEGHRVLGMFHGHYHASGAYRWTGYDVYNVGSPKHYHHSFAVVEIRGDVMKVASYNYDLRRFVWWHEKTIDRTPPRREVVGVADGLEASQRPDFSLTAENPNHGDQVE